MSDSGKAVFLSYASQDVEAARRIADALRAAGVEVWFDQSELVGGDAWDVKIRGQIASCALFVPVISAATQARREGYFRIEWRLAAQRTHAMSDDTAFLLPVVIDHTSDAAAKVPAEFKAVQWTRLPGGETPEKFCERVKKLLGGSSGTDVSPVSGNRGQHTRATPQVRFRVPLAVGLGLAAVVALAFWQPWRGKESPAASDAIAPAVPLTAAQELVRKARTILDEGDEMNRETYVFAEELLQKAELLDGTEGSAWALHTQLSAYLITFGLDPSPARRAALQSQADRTAKLMPGSPEAEIAVAQAEIAARQNLAGLARHLEGVAEKFPRDWRVLRELGRAYVRDGRGDEAVQAVTRARQIAPDEPRLTGDLLNSLLGTGQFAELDTSVGQAMQGRVNARILAFDVLNKLTWNGDLAGASLAVEKWPGWFLREDRGCYLAALVHLWNREPKQALAALNRLPRDYLRDSHFYGPKTVLTALAHEAAGEREAALADWRSTVQLADRELGLTADEPNSLHWKAWALARLGDGTEARRLFRLLAERDVALTPIFRMQSGGLAALAVAVGEPDAAIEHLAAKKSRPAERYLNVVTRTALTLNPFFEALRGDARFQAIVAAAPGPEKKPAATIAPVPDAKSVAVLPFANLSGDPAQEYFSDGLTEEILNALARERDLRVPGRTSSFSFKGKNVSAAEIAKALNVSRLVEGSVQRSGNLVRIRITLTRASDGFSEAFPSFDKELTNGAAIFALQDEVARAVVQKLTQRAPTRAVAVPTSNAAAYDLLLQGRAIVARGLAGADRAEALFQRAVDLDPNFALGWAHLAEATFREYAGMMDRSPERAEKTRAAIDRALALQPDLPEALIARADWERHVKGDYAAAQRDLARVETLRAPTGQLRYIQTYVERDMGNWAQALRYAEEAIQLDPQNGAYTYGFAIAVHGAHGDFAGADRLTARGMAIQGNGLTHAAGLRVSFRFLWRGPAAALRLLDGIPAVKDEDERRELYRAVLLYELGRPDEARATLAPIEPLLLQDVPEPGGTFGYRSDPVMALNCLLLLGRTETARTLTSRMRAFAETEMRRGNRTGTMRLLLIKAQVASGQRDEALAALQEWRRDSRATTNAFQRIRNFNDSAAMLYAALGRADEAIELLRELPSVGLRNLVSLRYQPDFAPIRNDPRFQELMRAQEAWAAAQPDPVEP